MATITDKISRATDSSTDRPIIATLAAPGKTIGAPSITLSSATNWSTSTPVYVALYTTTAAGVKDPTSQTDWKAILTGTTLSNLTITGGVDRTYSAGAYVEITFTAGWAKDMYDWMAAHGNADGSLKTTAVQSALSLGTGSLNGWNALGYAPNSVTANGNRSYDLVFNGNDLTGTLSAGMRLRTTRTVVAPTQCTNLNGTTQYYSKTTPAGAAQTDNITAFGWVKPTVYQSTHIIGRSSTLGTNGWRLYSNADGTVTFNGGTRFASTYQSLPLNKWTHVAFTINMSGSVVTAYFDGVSVPVTSLSSTGASWTAAGNLEIGSAAGGTGNFWAGKLAQVGFSSVVLTATQVKSLYSQGITSALVTSLSIVSAYSFSGSTSDLNTTNANNLTSNGSAVATTNDAPFGVQADGTNSTTLDYAIIQKASFSTNTTLTVQVPEGGTIPTSGGVASVVYSSQGKPYGMPTQSGKWRIAAIQRTSTAVTSNTTYGLYNSGGFALTVPVGEFNIGHKSSTAYNSTTDVWFCISPTALTGMSTTAVGAISPYPVRITSGSGTVVTSYYTVHPQTITSQQTYVMYTFGATIAAGLAGDAGQTEIFAENAYL